MKHAVGVGVVFVCAVAMTGFGINYWRHDLETRELDKMTRRGAPGEFVALPNGVVHYELKGPADGRTIVLVHGFSVPYYLWDPTFRTLVSAGFRVLRYDLFGRGLSDRPAGTYDANLYDRQLVDLLSALHIQGKVDLVGASLGGPIVATFTCRHRDQVRTVSFFDPGYSRGDELPFKLRAPGIGEYTMAVDIAPSLPEGQLADFLHPERFPDWPKRYRPQMRYKGFRRALLSTLRHYVGTDWSKEYACVGRMKAPSFLVWGEADQDVPFKFNSDVRADIPNVEFLPVRDAAHVPFLEHPEIVHPALLKFLSMH